MRIIYGLLLVLILNGLFFMADQTIANTTGSTTTMYSYSDSIASKYNDGNSTSFVIKDQYNGTMPSSQNAVDITGGGSYVDVFASFKEWIVDIPVLGVLFSILSAFHNILTMVGLPASLVFALDFIWYGFNSVDRKSVV